MRKIKGKAFIIAVWTILIAAGIFLAICGIYETVTLIRDIKSLADFMILFDDTTNAIIGYFFSFLCIAAVSGEIKDMLRKQ